MVSLDATYSLGHNLTGVGVYCRELLHGLCARHSEERFGFYYRPHRFFKSFSEQLPPNAARRPLILPPSGRAFHALNQRVHFRGRRTVTTFHDLFVMTGDYSTPEFRARFTDQARDAAQRSDLLIAVSAFTARQIESLLHVEPSRIRVVHHGTRCVEPSTHRENIVLTVGAIQKRKNLARMVRSFERMPPDWRFLIAGSPNGFGAAEELQAIHDSPRRSDIEVQGFVSNQQLEQLYQRASVFFFCSLDEGFGMPVLDAMAHGIPVVTSNRSAMPEVAGDTAILANPEDVEEMSAALSQAAQDSSGGRRGWARAQEFSWEKAVDATWRVYEELR